MSNASPSVTTPARANRMWSSFPRALIFSIAGSSSSGRSASATVANGSTGRISSGGCLIGT
jgi:hypothetical protein